MSFLQASCSKLQSASLRAQVCERVVACTAHKTAMRLNSRAAQTNTPCAPMYPHPAPHHPSTNDCHVESLRTGGGNESHWAEAADGGGLGSSLIISSILARLRRPCTFCGTARWRPSRCCGRRLARDMPSSPPRAALTRASESRRTNLLHAPRAGGKEEGAAASGAFSGGRAAFLPPPARAAAAAAAAREAPPASPCLRRRSKRRANRRQGSLGEKKRETRVDGVTCAADASPQRGAARCARSTSPYCRRAAIPPSIRGMHPTCFANLRPLGRGKKNSPECSQFRDYWTEVLDFTRGN